MKSEKLKHFDSGFQEIAVIRPEKDGEIISVQGMAESYYTKQTEFNHAVITFGNFFDRMRDDIIPVEKRWGVGQQIPKEVFVFPHDSTMNNLTRIANTEGAYDNLSLKKEYRRNLKMVLGTIKASRMLNPKATRVAVKRAGVVAAEFLHRPRSALVYEAKRLPFINGTLGVGMDDGDKILMPQNLDKKNIEIDEVFLASGSTILAFMIDCYSRSIEPQSLTIIAPFVAQQGAEEVLNLGSQIDWKVKILTNKIYYWLNNHWYVLVTPEEKIWQEVSGNDTSKEVQAGGDAGDLTEID